MSLPILANSFFEKHRPSLDVFLKWQKAANWSSRFMPLYHWDDVLFVGCAEAPTQKVQTDQKVVYVFCSADALSQLWEEYQSPTMVIAQSAPAPVIPSAIPQSASFDDLGILADSPETEEESSSPEESFEESLDLDLGTLTSAAPAASSQQEEADFLSAASIPLTPEEPAIEKTSIAASVKEILTAKPARIEDLEPKEESLPALNKSLPPEDVGTRTNITSITATNASPDQVCSLVFKEMSRNFEKTMVLVKQGEQIIPWKWDENFGKINPAAKKTAVSLAVPSPFRIVYRSHKSYHGYIVPNDLSEKFFAEWNSSEIPDHLTLSPIMVDENVVGMVLGIGSKTADTKACLLQTEHLADAVAKKVKGQPNLLKAA